MNYSCIAKQYRFEIKSSFKFVLSKSEYLVITNNYCSSILTLEIVKRNLTISGSLKSEIASFMNASDRKFYIRYYKKEINDLDLKDPYENKYPYTEEKPKSLINRIFNFWKSK